jgi:hypothetical protein
MSDEFVVPDVFGEVVGWRAWRVIGSEQLPMLASVTHGNTIWHPNRWTLATCGKCTECKSGSEQSPVTIPGEHCSCGMYAAKTREQLVSLGYNHYSDDAKPTFIGEVAFAGKVIPGSQGWRAQKARIKRLYVPFGCYRFVAGLERLYRVEVVLDNTFNRAPSPGAERS